MSIVWVASYILLWILVAGLVVLDVGLLQQIGLLQNRLDEAKAKPVERLPGPPSIDEDGPTLGSMVPSVDAESANDFGAVQLPSPEANSGQTLIILLSAMCETCQQLVAPLNAFVGAQQDGEGDHVQVVAFLRADEHGARASSACSP